MTELSYQDLAHPCTCVAVKKLIQEKKTFKIAKIPVEGLLRTVSLFTQDNNTINRAYKDFVRMLNDRSSYLNAELMLDGRAPNSRTIWLNIVRSPNSYSDIQTSLGKIYTVINNLARMIAEAVDLPTATVEKRISLSAMQEDRKIYYIQATEELILIVLGKAGFTFQMEWNKHWYEQIYTSAVSSVTNKHDMKTAKYDRLAHIQAEESNFPKKAVPLHRYGSASGHTTRENSPIPKIRGSSTSAINDDTCILDSDLVNFSAMTKNILESEGLGATYYNKMGKSNQALCAVAALLGFSVESDLDNQVELEAKLSIDADELFSLKMSKMGKKTKSPKHISI